MKGVLTVGELARELNLNPKTIRYYEEVGLLPNPRRSESGYRLYSAHEVERLRLVKRAKLLGLSLAEIKELVEYAVDGRCNALERRLLTLVEVKLGEIDQKIRDLTTLREDLTRYRSDLTGRLVSNASNKCTQKISITCGCIGEEVDSFGK